MFRVLLVPLLAVVLLWARWERPGGHAGAAGVGGVHVVPLTEQQQSALTALNLTVRNPIWTGTKTIHGRFLHITDIHPDPYYAVGADQAGACHGGKGSAGKYGDAILGCDAPMALMNETIRWVRKNLRDKIDFIVWTGDNVRHDNDRKYPRTEMQIFGMNEKVSTLMHEAFRNPDSGNPRDMLVDLVPSLGNNDVYPHNLFAPGPTLQTREMYLIWSHFVPEEQLHTFNRGAYYFKEVIPGQLAVLSINTLYLFQANPLVDNCDNRKQPGHKLFMWLAVVLKEMRARNMKVWLTGHVPPNEKNYDISCLRKYVVWSHEYRDVIIGGLYGHMNIDHFIPLDTRAAYKSLKDSLSKGKKKPTKKKSKKEKDQDIEIPDFDVSSSDIVKSHEDELDDYAYTQQPPMRIAGGVPANKVRYMESLRESYYAGIKKEAKSGVEGERYSIAHVSASVVPTFNPGLRVWEYNITGLDTLLTSQAKFAPWSDFFAGVDKLMLHLDRAGAEDDDIDATGLSVLKKDKTIPPKKPANLPLGPAFTPQTFSPLRYTQYYVDLPRVNSGEKQFGYEYEYSTDDYGMDTLLVQEWLAFGRKLGEPLKKSKTPADDKKAKKLESTWNTYVKHAFIDSNYENLGYG